MTALRASARQRAAQAGSRPGTNASTTGRSSGSRCSAATWWVSTPRTCLVIDQPCIGVAAPNPSAWRSTSRRPRWTTASPRVFAAAGSPAPVKAASRTGLQSRRGDAVGRIPPGARARGARRGRPAAPRRGRARGRGPAAAQPQVRRAALEAARPTTRSTVRAALSTGHVEPAAARRLAGQTSAASTACHGRPATKAPEHTLRAAMPAALRGSPMASAPRQRREHHQEDEAEPGGGQALHAVSGPPPAPRRARGARASRIAPPIPATSAGGPPAQRVHAGADGRVRAQRGELPEQQRALALAASVAASRARAPHGHAPLRGALRDVLEVPVAGEHRRRRPRPPAGQAGVAVRAVADERQPVGDRRRRHAELLAHPRLVAYLARAPVELDDAVAAHALRQVLVRRADDDLADPRIGRGPAAAAPWRRRPRTRPWARRPRRARAARPPGARTGRRARGPCPRRSCSRARARCGTTR